MDYKESNARQYGRQYNWYAVIDPRGIAPQGFHIPDHEDWSKLIYFLGGFKKEEMVVTKLTNPSGLSLFMDADYWNTTEVGDTTVGFLGTNSGLSLPNLPSRVKSIDLCPRWTDPHEPFQRPIGLGKEGGGFIRCLSDIEEAIGDIYWTAPEAGSTSNDDFM
ncbi:MAG: FISUMP domain-containing protein [Bacteroidales bacterium]